MSITNTTYLILQIELLVIMFSNLFFINNFNISSVNVAWLIQFLSNQVALNTKCPTHNVGVLRPRRSVLEISYIPTR